MVMRSLDKKNKYFSPINDKIFTSKVPFLVQEGH